MEPVQIINPNLHVILIHTPIAMLVIGTMIELFSFMWRKSGFRAAGRWMILIGALATIPASTTGMYAARQAMQGDEDATWTELKEKAPFNDAQWHNLIVHVRANMLGTLIVALLIVVWIGCSDHWRGKLHLIFMLLLLGALGLFSFGAWNGGEMVYSHQMGTHLVKGGLPTASSDSAPAEEASSQPSANPNEEKGKEVFKVLNATAAQASKFDNVLDLHAMAAGWTVAFALVTLGLSIRAISVSPRVPADDSMSRDEDIVQAFTPRDNPAATSVRHALMETGDLPTDDSPPARVPAARFWLVTVLIAICTMLSGWMLIGPDSFNAAWQTLQSNKRYLAHGIAGASMVVLSLILALITRFAPRNKVLIGCFALLLIAAISIQMWLAFLLTFDGSGGPLTRVN